MLLSPAWHIADCTLATAAPPIACAVRRGGVVLMRPLLLHASRTASAPGRRRVVHIEYAAGQLPGGLEWFVS